MDQVKQILKKGGLLVVGLLATSLFLVACGSSPTADVPVPTGASGNSALPASPSAANTTGSTAITQAGNLKTAITTTAPSAQTGPTPGTTASKSNPAPTAVPATLEAPAEGGLAGSGDEPTAVYKDPAGLFSFDYPRSWGKTTQNGETIRLTGRDEFISVTIISVSNQSPLDYAKSDLAALTKASPNFKATNGGPQNYKVAGQNGAMVAYTWQAGPSPVTNKLVPSSANRYYIPGPGGKLAIYTYSSPTNNYDPAGADDFANAFKWAK